MSKNEDKPKSSKIVSILMTFFFIIAILTSLFAVYEIYLLESIENMIRYIVMGVIGIIDLILLIRFLKVKKRRRKGLFLSFLFLYSIICIGIGGVIFYLYGQIDHLNKEKITYTSETNNTH